MKHRAKPGTGIPCAGKNLSREAGPKSRLFDACIG